MTILAFILIAYTLLMLLIHVSTGKILKAWGGPADSWIKVRFPPQRALRVEALYWLLACAGWTLWRPLAWKILIVVFAAIHLAVWLAFELNALHIGGSDAASPRGAGGLHQVIVAFDLIEAFVLAAAGIMALLFLLYAR